MSCFGVGKITSCISSFLQPSEGMTSGLSAYNFPYYITQTTLRPDAVVWDDTRKKLLLIELMVCFETMFEDLTQRKQAKYEELQQNTRGARYVTNIITLEVGSCGMVNDIGFAPLKDHLSMSDRLFTSLLQSLSLEAIRQSHQIWCCRNNLT